VRSARRLEAETHRNIEVIWLLRHFKPDFKTIAEYRPTIAAPFARSSASADPTVKLIIGSPRASLTADIVGIDASRLFTRSA